MRYAPEWLASLSGGRNPLDDRAPWLPFEARDWLRAHVGPRTSIFEYGSGGSTLFLSGTAGRVVSIEHDPAWFGQVSLALATSSRDNCEHMLYEPELETQTDATRRWGSRRPEFAGRSFERYVCSIDRHPDREFDLVIVDGRARLACIARALPKVRDGGHLLLDNSERPEYVAAFSTLARFERVDLRGLAPYRTFQWQTSIWTIHHARAQQPRA